MAGDLGTDGGQVHDKARAASRFWFEDVPADKQFTEDPALDAEIERRFGGWVEDLAATDATHCWDDPDTLLGAIVATDQFFRNIYRDSADAFANDFLASWLSLYAIGKGWDERYPPDRRAFLYMPLMHSEDWRLQSLSVGKFESLGIENNLKFARAHQDVVMRFGRFPSRNAALGRQSTADEEAYLSQPGAGW